MVITDLGHGETRYTLLSYRFSLKLGGEKRSPYITVYTGLCEDSETRIQIKMEAGNELLSQSHFNWLCDHFQIPSQNHVDNNRVPSIF